ncbi:kinase-like domain-containing protein [Clohesyomyces aquaticus]|uniref:cyclin-dependent kinase n=1 Tax=Clohesyomyces aquaticus TaxID=1231657 RepID=A0A1Y1ZWY9_9PLEO|nr:kinase-like domain-containing protein [Clohesyomyces aquaticus]
MAGATRWGGTEDLEAQRKKEKEEKKRLKQLKQQQAEAEAAAARERKEEEESEAASRPAKKRKLSTSPSADANGSSMTEKRKLLRFQAGGWGPCRNISNFETLNQIEEGSYGWVSRAKESATGDVVALKKMKMEYAQDGFPVTALREIQLLQASKHQHIINLREVVMGDRLDDVYLVMDFIEHDLKSLCDTMSEPFLASEVKTLILQLTSALSFLHSHWILHRDLKTSNILLNNRGILKIADFGMARLTSDPPPTNLTQLVVTLWYRAPELLLGATTYDSAIDMWSLGCIFGELLSKEPLLQGKNEVDQLTKTFSLCGLPSDTSWPAFRRLPNARALKLPRDPGNAAHGIIRTKFPFLTTSGCSLLSSLLSLNPDARPSAEDVLNHAYFKEGPKPKPTALFPTFPSKAGGEKRRRASPHAPVRGEVAKGLGDKEIDFSGIFAKRDEEERGAGFTLRMG